MVKKALELLRSLQAQFIITGEVLTKGQRVKKWRAHGSSKRQWCSGSHLRPLSAKLLPPTNQKEKAGLTAPYCWIFKEDLAKGNLS